MTLRIKITFEDGEVGEFDVVEVVIQESFNIFTRNGETVMREHVSDPK